MGGAPVVGRAHYDMGPYDARNGLLFPAVPPMKSMTAMASSVEALRPGFIPATAPQADRTAERPPQPEANDLEPSVYRFILKHSLKRQILLLLLTLASFPFLYYSLDLPKTIVNRAIAGKQFPEPFLGF